MSLSPSGQLVVPVSGPEQEQSVICLCFLDSCV